MAGNPVAIRVSNLSKSYQMYDRPEDRLKQSILPRLRGLFGRPAPNYYRDFWALRDVSFEVHRGETLGIIGRNGSGKSTLLQIICGTLTPTTGTVEITGRVAALLELGAGFNPEFTGRENVYLNATLFGLTRAEVDARLDAIAAFADIGSFFDQPVKTYSSGMYVRLAFAVIAHVDADILVVDEALAVGDAAFTQKCMRFIRRFQELGTLLFVSHDTGAVVNLCRTSVWLGDGSIRMFGASKEVSEAYLQSTLQSVYGEEVRLEGQAPADANATSSTAEAVLAAGSLNVDVEPDVQLTVRDNVADSRGWQTGLAEVLAVTMNCVEEPERQIFLGGERLQVRVLAIAHKAIPRPILGFTVRDRLGQDLFGENTQGLPTDQDLSIPSGGRFAATFEFRLPMLPNGQYAVMASVADGDAHNNVQHHMLHEALILTVSSSRYRYGLVGIPFENVTLERCS